MAAWQAGAGQAASVAARCYGARQLSPLRAVVEVVQTETTRALSDDGLH